MTAHAKAGDFSPAPRPFSATTSKTSFAHGQYGVNMAKLLSESERLHKTQDEVLAEIVEKALWKSFPEEHSEEGIAVAAAPYFRNKHGEPISPRTIRYWLRRQTLPSALHLSTLVMMQPKLFLSYWLGAGS